MKLVLNDQIGRVELPAVVEGAPFASSVVSAIETDAFGEPINVAEESAGLADPWQARKLVDGGNEKRRQTPIDWLVDRQDRQRPIACEVATEVGATDFQVDGRNVVGDARE